MIKLVKVLVKRSRLNGGSLVYFVVPSNVLLKTKVSHV